jgi:hypothetical protein
VSYADRHWPIARPPIVGAAYGVTHWKCLCCGNYLYTYSYRPLWSLLCNNCLDMGCTLYEPACSRNRYLTRHAHIPMWIAHPDVTLLPPQHVWVWWAGEEPGRGAAWAGALVGGNYLVTRFVPQYGARARVRVRYHAWVRQAGRLLGDYINKRANAGYRKVQMGPDPHECPPVDTWPGFPHLVTWSSPLPRSPGDIVQAVHGFRTTLDTTPDEALVPNTSLLSPLIQYYRRLRTWDALLQVGDGDLLPPPDRAQVNNDLAALRQRLDRVLDALRQGV